MSTRELDDQEIALRKLIADALDQFSPDVAIAIGSALATLAEEAVRQYGNVRAVHKRPSNQPEQAAAVWLRRRRAPLIRGRKMPDTIERWKARADAIAEKVTESSDRATPDDLRTIAVVAAVLLVVDELASVTRHWEL